MAARKKQRRRFHWRTVTQWVAQCERDDGRNLLVVVIPADDGTWSALALDTDADNAVGVLASHGHHVIGEYEAQPAARTAAQSYARSWLSGEVGAPKCGCDEIPSGDRDAEAPP